MCVCVFLLQLVPVWNSKLCGQYRSIVRMIGTNLQLAPVPRVHFQVGVALVSRDRRNYIEKNFKKSYICICLFRKIQKKEKYSKVCHNIEIHHQT